MAKGRFRLARQPANPAASPEKDPRWDPVHQCIQTRRRQRQQMREKKQQYKERDQQKPTYMYARRMLENELNKAMLENEQLNEQLNKAMNDSELALNCFNDMKAECQSMKERLDAAEKSEFKLEQNLRTAMEELQLSKAVEQRLESERQALVTKLNHVTTAKDLAERALEAAKQAASGSWKCISSGCYRQERGGGALYDKSFTGSFQDAKTIAEKLGGTYFTLYTSWLQVHSEGSHTAGHAEDRSAETYQLVKASQSASVMAASTLPWSSRYTTFKLEMYPFGDPVCELMKKKFLESFVSHRKDLNGTSTSAPPRVKVVKVEAVINPRLIEQYYVTAQNIHALRKGGVSSIPALSELKCPVRMGCPDLNEHFLFHGSTHDVVQLIAEGGFDPRRGGTAKGRLFGFATYLAANASKSDIYTDDFEQRASRRSERKILVVRVMLGEAYCTKVQMQDATMPPEGSDGRPYDSVWAETKANGGVVDHKEVMIYDKGQAYPEAIITYIHDEGCKCSECRRRPHV